MSVYSHINEILDKAEKDSQLCEGQAISVCPRICLDKLYKSMLCPLLDYCDAFYDSCTMYLSKQFNKLQRKASLLCTK